MAFTPVQRARYLSCSAQQRVQGFVQMNNGRFVGRQHPVKETRGNPGSKLPGVSVITRFENRGLAYRIGDTQSLLLDNILVCRTINGVQQALTAIQGNGMSPLRACNEVVMNGDFPGRC